MLFFLRIILSLPHKIYFSSEMWISYLEKTWFVLSNRVYSHFQLLFVLQFFFSKLAYVLIQIVLTCSIFTHLKLWAVVASHSFNCVKI